MTKALEPNDHQPNKKEETKQSESASVVDTQATIELKVGNNLEQESRIQRRQQDAARESKADPKTREEKRKAELEEGKANRKGKRRLKVRLFPVWLRLVIIVLLALIALVVGTMIGYGVLGKGNPMDVFNPGTWTHITDIVTKTK